MKRSYCDGCDVEIPSQQFVVEVWCEFKKPRLELRQAPITGAFVGVTLDNFTYTEGAPRRLPVELCNDCLANFFERAAKHLQNVANIDRQSQTIEKERQAKKGSKQ